jgi:IclR family transcriptional regulator, KDG regulon repressor
MAAIATIPEQRPALGYPRLEERPGEEALAVRGEPATKMTQATPAPAQAEASVRAEEDRGGTSVDKAILLLIALSESAGRTRLTDLAAAAALPKSTAHRLLALLEARGMVRRTRQEYALGDAVFELGNRLDFCQPAGLRELALPYLGDLFACTGQTVTLSILSGADVLFLDKLSGSASGKSPALVGGRLPAHCTAPGKALLAYSDLAYLRRLVAPGLRPRTGRTVVYPKMLLSMLSRVRTTGVARDYEETSIGRACIAAPIVVRRRAIAAVAVSAITTERPEQFIPRLQRAAEAIQVGVEQRGIAALGRLSDGIDW